MICVCPKLCYIFTFLKVNIKYQFVLRIIHLVLKVYVLRLLCYNEISFNSHPYPSTILSAAKFYLYNKYFHLRSPRQPEFSHIFVQVDLKNHPDILWMKQLYQHYRVKSSRKKLFRLVHVTYLLNSPRRLYAKKNFFSLQIKSNIDCQHIANTKIH